MIAERPQHALLICAYWGVSVLQRCRQIGPAEAPGFGHRRARDAKQFVPRGGSASHRIPIGHGMSKEAFDVGFGLTRRAVQVEAQHVQHAQERPEIRRPHRLAFEVADDLPQFPAIMDGLLGNESVSREPLVELGGGARCARTIQ